MLDKLVSIIKTVSARELLTRFNASRKDFETKCDGSIVTQADVAMQSGMARMLLDQWPDIAILGEEMDSRQQQAMLQSTDTFWCLDPLDGTSNFASGIPFFAVSLALIVNKSVKLAVIYDPVRDECFTAEQGGISKLNGVGLEKNDSTKDIASMIAVIDLKRLEIGILNKLVKEHPYRSQRNFGSCALEWCWLAANRFQLYLHGGMKIWDHAAGSLILETAGGFASSLDSDSVFVPELTPRSVIAAGNRETHDRWKRWIIGIA